jgi:signal transduction histidine kinase
MNNGVNYYVKQLKDLPFIIIVNIDNNVIKRNILDSVTKKFIEVSIFAVICLAMVVAIYKRETILRSRSEKATKIATEATKAKTNFLAFTAHEVRSPLGFILTGTEIMQKELLGELPKPYHGYVEGIHQNASIILDFITDILDENQIIEGKFKIVNSMSNIKIITQEAIKVNQARYNNCNIIIIDEYDGNLPMVVCDKRRMVQALGNLISNSIKYSYEGGKIIIKVSIVDFDMIISVIDNGKGMKQEDIKIALTGDGTGQNSHGHSVGSYGLGLPIVRTLLEAHDAKLSIISQLGQGTTVTIRFPKYKLVYNNTLISSSSQSDDDELDTDKT